MTRDEAKKLLPVIQAFADGKEVQANAGGSWINAIYPDFPPCLQWRIKPEPLECWVVRYSDGSLSSRETREKAELLVRSTFSANTSTIHHMREVIE